MKPTRRDYLRSPFVTSGMAKAAWGVAAYTRDAAYTAFADANRGTLAPGNLADVVVLSHDLFKADPLEIAKTPVLLAMVGGKIVQRDPQLEFQTPKRPVGS